MEEKFGRFQVWYNRDLSVNDMINNAELLAKYGFTPIYTLYEENMKSNNQIMDFKYNGDGNLTKINEDGKCLLSELNTPEILRWKFESVTKEQVEKDLSRVASLEKSVN